MNKEEIEKRRRQLTRLIFNVKDNIYSEEYVIDMILQQEIEMLKLKRFK